MAQRSAALAIMPEDTTELERLVRSSRTEQRVALRSRMVLAAAQGAGVSNKEMAETLSIALPTVMDWRKRYAAEGIAGLVHDRPRGKACKALGTGKEAAVVKRTLQEKPVAATPMRRLMAKVMGLSKNSVQRLWNAHGLKPHLVRTGKLSNDSPCIAQLRDVVGLSMNPPDNAWIVRIDEKSQRQALDRTRPGLPMKTGRAGTMTHESPCHGTTTLCAALDVLQGEGVGQCLSRHRPQECLKLPKLVDKHTPPPLDLHGIVAHDAPHTKQAVQDWLAKPPRCPCHVIPTASSSLPVVEPWFRDRPVDRIRRDTFRSVVQLHAAIYDSIAHNNQNPTPFVWTQSADAIITKVNRGKALLGTLH